MKSRAEAVDTEVLGLSVYRDGEAFGGEREERKRIGIKVEIWLGNRGDSMVAQLVKNLPAMQETRLIPGSGRSTGEGIGYPFQYSWASLVTQLVRIHLQYRKPGFNPWVGRSPWRRELLSTPVFWLGEFHGLYSPWGCKELDMTKRLSLYSIFKRNKQKNHMRPRR